MGGVEPLSQAWEARVIAVIRHPHTQRANQANIILNLCQLLYIFLTNFIKYSNYNISEGKCEKTLFCYIYHVCYSCTE